MSDPMEPHFDITECINHNEDCTDDVQYRGAPPDGVRMFQRCSYHADKRWESYENSDLERWADSDIPPPWFDPSLAGERWNEDD